MTLQPSTTSPRTRWRRRPRFWRQARRDGGSGRRRHRPARRAEGSHPSRLPRRLVDLKPIPGAALCHSRRSRGLRMGALATLDEVAAHPEVRRGLTRARRCGRSVASPQIRNMAHSRLGTSARSRAAGTTATRRTASTACARAATGARRSSARIATTRSSARCRSTPRRARPPAPPHRHRRLPGADPGRATSAGRRRCSWSATPCRPSRAGSAPTTARGLQPHRCDDGRLDSRGRALPRRLRPRPGRDFYRAPRRATGTRSAWSGPGRLGLPPPTSCGRRATRSRSTSRCRRRAACWPTGFLPIACPRRQFGSRLTRWLAWGSASS